MHVTEYESLLMLELAGFATFALVSSITPGPNNMLMTTLGAFFGFRRGLPALFGIAFGFAVMIFLISLGLSRFIIEADPVVAVAMRVIGSAVILSMAWQIATLPTPTTSAQDRSAPPTMSRLGAFVGAATFQWANPKAWIICAAAITAYLDQNLDLLPQATAFALVFMFASLAGCTPWLAMGSFIGRYLRGKRARIFNVAMSLLLVGSMIPVML